MSARGHNERSFRLDALAAEAREGLSNVEKGEEFTIGGWLAYGHALNEGRALFPGDKEFGEWVALSQLGTRTDGEEIKRDDRAAAMWAAANADQFEEGRQRGNPRTIRGIHAKWKEIEAEREAEQRRQEAEERKAAETPQSEAESKPDQEQGTTTSAIKDTANAPVSHAADTAHPAADQEPEPDRSHIGAEPEPTPDPYGYAKLTEDALLELANGLRADLDDEKAKRKAAEAEAKALKAQLRDFEGEDKDEVIRRLQAAVKNAENAKWKALEDRDAYHRQLHAARKERDAAVKSLEAQEITL